MSVSMMRVGIVRMGVPQPSVHVPVRVRLTGGRSRLMFVPVVLVVPMKMLVCELFVHMLVRVTFADVQPHADGRQHAADDEPKAQRLTEGHDRDGGPDERRYGKTAMATRRTVIRPPQ